MKIQKPYTVIFDWTEACLESLKWDPNYPDPEAPVYLVWADNPNDASDIGDEKVLEEYGPTAPVDLKHVVVLRGHAEPFRDFD
ncbi:hypothetical protein ABZW10_28475 [Kitasatospora sp. NPDC004723]|uniref:hypothetical protein n=1 Tax=Kitasatospora sp. NPDC004723 TaxID=3154288 RepID=UPI0033BA2D13